MDMFCSKVPDSTVPNIVSLLERVVEHGKQPIGELRLETYISQNFMGFFLNEDSAEVIKSTASRFTRELSQISMLGIVLLGHTTSVTILSAVRHFGRSPHASPASDVGLQLSIEPV